MAPRRTSGPLYDDTSDAESNDDAPQPRRPGTATSSRAAGQRRSPLAAEPSSSSRMSSGAGRRTPSGPHDDDDMGNDGGGGRPRSYGQRSGSGGEDDEGAGGARSRPRSAAPRSRSTTPSAPAGRPEARLPPGVVPYFTGGRMQGEGAGTGSRDPSSGRPPHVYTYSYGSGGEVASGQSRRLGAASRLRADKRTGALAEVAGRYRTSFGAQHAVSNALKRSVADAYAAYVGQVVGLPDDLYGLALYALDRAFHLPHEPTSTLDFNLHTSPYVTSRAKHAQIFNTARKILHDLEGYVHDIAPSLPGELDQLEAVRQDTTGTRGNYKSGRPVQATPPDELQEAVAIDTTRGSKSTRPKTAPERAAADDQPEATLGGSTPPDASGRLHAERPHGGRSPAQQRPRTSRRAAERAARDVAAALGSASEAEADERRDGQQGAGRLPPADPAEERHARSLKRMSSPGMYVKTPPHYRAARFYDHTSPTQEVVDYMRKRVKELQARVHQALVAASAGGAAAGSGDAPTEGAQQQPPRGGPPPQQLERELAALMQQLMGVSPPPGSVARPRRSGRGAWQHSAGPGPSAQPRQRRYADGNDAPVAITGFAPAAKPRAGAAYAPPAAAAADADGYPHRNVTPADAAASTPRSTGSPMRAPGAGAPTDTYTTITGAMARPSARSALPGDEDGAAAPPVLYRHPDERIEWIIDTAHELGLAQALGMDEPRSSSRSRRLSPVRFRRTHYEAVYSSPERYGQLEGAHEYEQYQRQAAAADAALDGAAAEQAHYHQHYVVSPDAVGEVQPVQPPEGVQGVQGRPVLLTDQHPNHFAPRTGVLARAAAAAAARRHDYDEFEYAMQHGGIVSYRVEMAAARRAVRDADPPPPRKAYARSRRLSPQRVGWA